MHTQTRKNSKPQTAAGRQPRPTRRVFTSKYKLRVLAEADGCTEPGEIGALLRREGLYSSHLSKWREQQRRGTLAAMGRRRRGPAPRQTAEEKEVDRLRRENAKLTRRLEQAEKIIAAQKKLSELLESMSEMPETGEDT